MNININNLKEILENKNKNYNDIENINKIIKLLKAIEKLEKVEKIILTINNDILTIELYNKVKYYYAIKIFNINDIEKIKKELEKTFKSRVITLENIYKFI